MVKFKMANTSLQLYMFETENDMAFSGTVTFKYGRLPFPLSHSKSLQICVSIILLCILIFGLILRGLILKFLNTLDSKNRPINVLLWMDQANGMFGTETIIHLFLAINLESSLRDLFGLDFCKWMHFSAGKINTSNIHGGAKMLLDLLSFEITWSRVSTFDFRYRTMIL